MNTDYIRQAPTDDDESLIEPRNLYTVTNLQSHYFGCVVEQIDSYYRHESDCVVLWVKDAITGLWFGIFELESIRSEEDCNIDYDPRDPLDEGDGISDL